MNETPTLTTGTATPQRPSLGLVLRQAHMRAARIFTEELRPLDLDNSRAAILIHVGLLGLLTQRQLVESMGVDKSAMVRSLDALEARGLVRREPHPTDRRAHVVVVTEEGQEMVGRVAEAVDRTEARTTACFTPEERELFHSLALRFACAPDEAPSA